MTHLFLFTLGPVQSFIAQARKVHDLYSGSRLLSEMCRTAAEKFESYEGEIIFPDINSDSIPNRFLGKIVCDNNRLSIIGKAVADAVQNKWKKHFDDVFELMLDRPIYQEACRQIEQHLDIQWLFQSLVDDSDETYRATYNELNKKLNAIKNTRPFHTLEETGRKCNLDGERNVLFYRLSQNQKLRSTTDNAPLYSNLNLVLNYDDISGNIKLRHLQPGEGLSAVSMLKRFYDFDADDFPDTAQFALSETMYQIGDRYVNEMTKLFGHDHFKHLNWQLFYEENLTKRYFEKQGLPINKLQNASEIQKDFAAKAQDKGRKLEKYYALIVFDGDHMGEWWKGSQLKQGIRLEDFHKNLTGRLAEYAKFVREEYTKKNHHGWVIYAGGDDFLGFFNLHHLIEEISFLTKKYEEVVHNPLSDQIKDGYKLTFSMGVCIAHYKEPLSLVLAQAREMEHSAKNIRDEKDAIGIAVIPGSGQVAKVVLPSEQFIQKGKIVSDLQTPNFSNAFVSKIRTELTVFMNDYGSIVGELLEPSKKLVDRAVSRACNLTKNEGETEEAFQFRQYEVVAPLQNAIKSLLNSHQDRLVEFFDAMDIADFIERQTHITKPKTQPTEV